jgi:antitoxin (DNA-binding transcriptional repressor) of toxin-antitoxin stability system
VKARVSIAEARERLPELVAELDGTNEAVVVECDGRAVAAIVPPSSVELDNEREQRWTEWMTALDEGADEITDEAWEQFVEGLEIARGRPFPELHLPHVG